MASASDADLRGTVAGLWAFADRFARLDNSGKNAVFSPASIGYAFGMLRGGAGGATARQLDEVFGFPATVHDAFASMGRDIVTTGKPPQSTPRKGPYDPPKPPVVAIANGLFLQDDYEADQKYQQLLREKYGARAEHVDFNSDEAKQIIDAWVKKQTAGRISKLFDEIDPDTIAVLANAVYLKADWAEAFNPDMTADEPFHRADGTNVQAPMMHFTKPLQLNYVKADDWQAVELPYAGGELAMWVLVPTKGTTAPRLTAEALANLGDAKPGIVDLTLPRWDFSTDIELLEPLEKLGVTALDDLPAFGPAAFVGQAVHRANITVDELGTEASAVTGIAVESSGPPTPDLTLRADRPFTFAIVHKPTGAPIFLGTVADPSAS